jgi:hypothetical protein
MSGTPGLCFGEWWRSATARVQLIVADYSYGPLHSRGGKAVRLTYDHKGSDAHEAKRITDAGGFVMNNRVNGESRFAALRPNVCFPKRQS